MPKKKVAKDPQDELDATCKLLCDEAANHMKVRNYTKALSVYQKVGNVLLFDSIGVLCLCFVSLNKLLNGFV